MLKTQPSLARDNVFERQKALLQRCQTFALEFEFTTKAGQTRKFLVTLPDTADGGDENLVAVEFPRTISMADDDGCNDRGCGCNQPAPMACTYTSGESGGCSNRMCACSVNSVSGCYGEVWCGGGCSVCDCNDDPIAKFTSDPFARAAFFTDPLRADHYFDDDTKLRDVVVGADL